MHLRAQHLTLILLLWLGACQAPPLQGARWAALQSGTRVSLRGLHALDHGTFWATGSKGTVLRCVDGKLEVRRVPGEEENEVRDVHAFDADTALVMACQPARLYRTIDGGRTFARVLDAGHDKAFFDGLSFFDRSRGIVFGDPIDGRFMIYTTEDGGVTWQRVARAPEALPGEGGFAASGTCLAVMPGGAAWIGTGIRGARVLASMDHGRSWRAVESPLAFGEAAGIFSFAFRDEGVGVIVGGDYRASKASAKHAAFTADGGMSWQLSQKLPRAFRSCAAYDPLRPSTLIAVGPSGTDYSPDDGRIWYGLNDTGFHVVSFAADGTCWAAGSGGRVARLELAR